MRSFCAMLVAILALLGCNVEVSSDPGDASVGATGGGGTGAGGSGGFDAVSDGGEPDATAPAPHQFKMEWNGLYLPECDSGKCADGKSCYSLTKELAVCDAPALVAYDGGAICPAAAPCAPNECGCSDAGSCDPDRICKLHQVNGSCASTTTYFGKCVETPCSSAAYCPVGEVCLPPSYIFDTRCVGAKCADDADCAAIPGGVCGAVSDAWDQGGQPYLLGLFCVYPGGTGAAAFGCANPGFVVESQSDVVSYDYHYCP